jgi:membrane fusion protein, multidrug efflux system
MIQRTAVRAFGRWGARAYGRTGDGRLNALIVLGMALLWAGCHRAEAKPALTQVSETPIRVEAVQHTSSAPAIEATGVLAPREEVRLSFKIGGVVAAIAVEEGQRVQAGQVIARLDSREIDAQVAKAKSGLDKAERDLVRARNLYRDSVATLEQVQNATTALDVAQSDYETARFNHRHAVIVAPSSAVVLSRLAEPGELVSAGQSVLLLGNDAAGTIVRVALSDRDAVRIRSGDRAQVTFEAMPAQVFSGRVTQTAAAANAQTGTYTVEVSLVNGPRGFNGLIGRVRLQPSGQASVRTVPIEAINEADGSEAVIYALNDDNVTVRRVPVRLGFIHGDRIAVVSGLEQVARIATAGSAYLTDGSRVKVVQ